MKILLRGWHIQCFFGFDGLDHGLVVVLVDFAVNSGGYLFVLLREDMFLGDGLSNVLINGCLVLSVLGEEVGNCLLCFLHCFVVELK